MSIPHPATSRSSLSGQERSYLLTAAAELPLQVKKAGERGLFREPGDRKKRCLKDRNLGGEEGPLKHSCPGSPTHWNETSDRASLFPSVK